MSRPWSCRIDVVDGVVMASSDELEAVEALPPASTVSALWSAVLAAKAVVLEAEQAEELRELLEETKVRVGVALAS